VIPSLFGLQAPVLVALGSAFGYAAMLVWVIRRRGWRSWPVRSLLIFLALSALWGLGFGLNLWFGLPADVTLLGLRLAYAMLMLVAPLLVILTLLYLERPGARWVLVASLAWLVLVLMIELNLFDLQTALVGAGVISLDDLVRPLQIAGWAGFSLGAFALVGLDFVQTRRPLHRNRILFWLLGIALVSAGETFTVLDRTQFVIDVTQIGLAVRLVGVMLIAYATTNYRLPVLRSMARQVFTAVLTTIALGALVFAGMWVVLTTANQTVSLATLVVAIIAAGVLAIFQQPLRVLMHRWIDRLVNRGNYDPARALRDYGEAINNILDLDTLVTVAVGIIAEALDVRRGTLMLITERDDQTVDVQLLQGMGALSIERAEFTADSAILAELQHGTKPLTQYEIDILPQYRTALAKERTWLQSLDMEVYVPIRSQSVLVGVFAIGRRESGEPHSDQDLDVLMTVGNQTAVVLQNARLVSDLKSANRSITHLNDELTESNRRLEKLDVAKTDFIEIASHELRTPLTQIRGYSDILSDMVSQGALVEAHLNQISGGITRASVRLEAIIAAMLDVSRIDAQALDIHTAPLSLPTVIKLALDNYREAIRERSMNIQLVELEQLPRIQGDQQRLCQAFTNIIGNSIKFTPDGGAITISGRLLNEPTQRDVQIYIELLIADTGIGIDRNDQQLIFEKFYRVGAVELHSTGSTKFKGAGPGLGLPIAKGIIHAHGGKIWVESPGHDEEKLPGSTFHVVLPATLPVAAHGEQQREYAVA
jgi:signal transduction histidine kinase